MDTSTAERSRSNRRAARAEAAAWIVRLHGPHRSPELEAGFRAWLAADPENARQFERVTDVWDAGSAPVAGIPRMARWRESSTSRNWARAAMILLVCGLGAWALNDLWLNPSYSTRLGEQRLVRLTDGSRVSLNSNTRIQVTYRDTQRRVQLERGEAYFEVAHNPARPFIVLAGDHQVTALGTSFVVRYEPSRTAVTLVEGKVTVRSLAAPVSGDSKTSIPSHADPGVPVGRPESPDAGAAQSSGSGPDLASALNEDRAVILLSPGQRLTFAGSATAKLDEPSLDAVTAWRRGEVMLDRTALADAIAEMNRYDETTLIIDDPSIAALRVSGIYHAGDSEVFAETVARLYGLDVVQQSDRIHLRLHAAPESGPAELSGSND